MKCTQLGSDEIKQLLPHRLVALNALDYVLVDSEDLNTVFGYKIVEDDDLHLEGHFPGKPIYPGHWQYEGACLAAAICAKLKIGAEVKGFPILAGADGPLDFKLQFVPGDTIIYEVNLIKSRFPLFIFDAKIYKDNHGGKYSEIRCYFCMNR